MCEYSENLFMLPKFFELTANSLQKLKKKTVKQKKFQMNLIDQY